MNFLELINKCLLELNYKTINSISELVKNDHKRIVQIINIINKEICTIEGWNFLLRRTSLNLNAGETEIENPINGRILYLYIDNEKYKYSENIDEFLTGKAEARTYSSISNKLLFPKFDKQKEIKIVYYTNNSVIDGEGNEKQDFEHTDDKSIIPMPFAEQLLVYGTCLRLKANPQYVKFSYWIGMYKEALQNLKAKTHIDFNHSPTIKIHRN